ETAADVGGDDVDLVFGNLRDQRTDGTNDVRGLERAPQREFARDLVEGGDALAGLKRTRMHARIDDQLFDRNVGFFKGRIGCRLVARRPGEDVIVVFALAVRAVGLVLDVLTDHRRIGGHRLERIDVDGQRLVLHLDQIGGIGRRIAVLCDYKRNLLV